MTITSYDLRHIRSDAQDKADSEWTETTGIATTDTDSYDLTGLGGGVAYDLKIRAVNSSGAGPWSETISGTTTDVVPIAPTITTVTGRSRELLVSWTRPEDGTASLIRYELRHIRRDASESDKLDDDMWTITSPAWSTGDGPLEATIGTLDNDVQYDLQVRARNALGDGLWSGPGTGTPQAANQDPEFPSSETGMRSISENVSTGSNVGSVVRATDSNGDPLTYTLNGADADSFMMVETTDRFRLRIRSIERLRRPTW